MPIAALIGTIYALSKLAANSEFTIMRVSGMSTRRLMNSLIGIGLIIVALTYVLGEFISPPAEQLAQKARLQATDSPVSVREFRSGVWVRDVVREPGIGVFRRFASSTCAKSHPTPAPRIGGCSSLIATTNCVQS